jgi:excisionase family DNA binding protein
MSKQYNYPIVPPDNSARLVKIPQAAQMLSLSIPTVRRLIAQGDLRVNRKVRHLLIPISEIERFINV